MAVYIKMIKKYDDDKKVVYRFGPNERLMGEIEFDKEEKIFNIFAFCLFKIEILFVSGEFTI